MKNKIRYIFFLLFLLFPSKVLSDTYTLSLTCPEVVSPSQNIECSVNVNNPDFNINKISGSFSFTGGITSQTNSLNVDNILIDSTSTISTFMINVPSTAKSNDKYTISINNIIANDSISTANVTKTIRVVSSDTSLKDISLSNGSLTYDSSSSTYNAIINDSTTIISASTNDPLSTIKEGTGEKILKYGKNEFNIVVLSESKETKSYPVIITRPDNRSNNNYLSSLFVTNTNIDFTKTKTEYNLSTTASEVLISATKEDNKSTISGDIGKKSLKYGTNSFNIKVTAENNSTKIYTINITRVDNRSDNNYLKSITLSEGNINFNKNTTTYNITVDKLVEKIKINAVLADTKAKFVTGYSPREVNLNMGNNTIYLKIESENGRLRTYTLNINRDDGRDSDSTLKDITLSEGNIEFDKDKHNYTINVENEVEKIKIYATANSSKSKVKIDGKEDLLVGKNKFIITVEAENGAKTVYTVLVNRKEKGYKLSSNNYIKKLKIKNYNISFSKTTYDYTVITKEDSLDIDIELEDINSSYEIIDNEKLKNGSKIIINVMAEDGSIRHAYFAEDLYNKLDKKIKNNIKNYKENLKTYSQGHDIFFFTLNILNFRTRKIGNYMHKNDTRNFFKNMIIYIKENNLQDNYEIMSFLYGFIAHYSLDSTVHPYVTYKTGIFKRNKKETYKYNSKHSDLESYIDAYMINKRENIIPNKFKIHNFCFNTKVSNELSKLIDNVFEKTYGFKHMSIYVKEGIFNMKVSYRLLRYDPYKIKKGIYKSIDKILPKWIKKISPISYTYTLNNNDYYLNLKHKKWNHPRYKDEVYTYSFLDLYNNALDMCLDIIKGVNDILYNNAPVKNLDKIFLNISFSSGKDCNDKTKNKYFEY